MTWNANSIDRALRRLAPAETESLATDPVSMAALLGVSPSTLARWAKAGLIPAVKIGGRVLFPVQDVRDWLTLQARAGMATALNEQGRDG